MTPGLGRNETAALQFLVEDFIDVPESATAKAARALQEEAARTLLSGLKLQQRSLLALSPAEFHKLRRQVRERLEIQARHNTLAPPGVGLRLAVKLTLVLPFRTQPGETPIVEGTPRDVLWFYVAHLVNRAGTSRLAVCAAPRSQREPGPARSQRGPDLCGRLYLRRGRAKQFCSPRCRARVATQRARRRPARRHR